MKQLASCLLLRDFIDVLSTDLASVGEGHIFTCRPLKGATAEQDTVLGRFRGNITLSGTREFQLALDELVTDKLVKVILDFANVTLSRTAIGALVAFAGTIHGRNKRLYLYRVSDQIRTSLQDLHLTEFFTFLENEEDILAALVV